MKESIWELSFGNKHMLEDYTKFSYVRNETTNIKKMFGLQDGFAMNNKYKKKVLFS